MYSLFSNVLVVNGALRSAIYDVQRETHYFIPKWLGDFLIKNKQFNISELGDFGDFFLSSELIHLTESTDIKLFPQLRMDYHTPCLIEVLVFDCSIYNSLKIDIASIVEALNIQKILFYVRNQECIQSLQIILNELQYSRLHHIEIIFFEQFNFSIDIFNNEHRIRKIYFYESKEKTIKSDTEHNRLEIYLNWSFNNRTLWQQQPNFFNVNLTLFSESQHFNTYYHKRLYIGLNGEISNGEYSNPISNIEDIEDINTLIELVKSEEFCYLYSINKEIVDVCEHCEFRHMCIDSRIPIKREKQKWYHQQECNYNPYICKWEGEEGYRTLDECGVVSNENEFSVDHHRIAKINRELWED